jgi:hypothetical protein
MWTDETFILFYVAVLCLIRYIALYRQILIQSLELLLRFYGIIFVNKTSLYPCVLGETANCLLLL